MDKAENYAKSNSITAIPNLSISNATKVIYHKYRDAKVITEIALQRLSDAIFRDLGQKPLEITFAGRRPHNRNETRVTRETLGVHSGSMWSQSIQIYKYTAARKQLVSAKSAISTLLHEINHNIDLHIIKVKSIHSKGFYLRLKHLTIEMG